MCSINRYCAILEKITFFCLIYKFKSITGYLSAYVDIIKYILFWCIVKNKNVFEIFKSIYNIWLLT